MTSKETAATVRDLMVGVVSDGTGVAAARRGVQVAGKAGCRKARPGGARPRRGARSGEEAPQELDAWFTSFAPANDPSSPWP